MHGKTLIESLVIGVIIFIVGILILTILGGIVASPIIAHSTRQEVTFIVNDKSVVVSGSGDSTDSTYLIYTTAGVFRDDDSLWYWKWNSSDVYNELERGKTYRATVYGFRVPFLSWYKNIVNVESI